MFSHQTHEGCFFTYLEHNKDKSYNFEIWLLCCYIIQRPLKLNEETYSNGIKVLALGILLIYCIEVLKGSLQYFQFSAIPIFLGVAEESGKQQAKISRESLKFIPFSSFRSL